jgi:hypothetical protein
METSRLPVNCTRGYKMGELATRGAVLLETAAVRKLTEDVVTVDNLEQADYWDLYQKERSKYRSLSQFAEAMGEYPSKAEWSRWDRGEIEARRPIRDALRRASGLPVVETVAEIVDKHTQSDSLVFFLGENDKASVVLLVGDISLWNDAEVSTTTNGANGAVPAGTKARRPCYRPRLRDDQGEAIAALGMSAEELVDWALEMKRREV